MNEELLLTPEKKLNICHKQGECKHMGNECPVVLGAINEACQAQLHKVLHPPELDKPDGEGWWWFKGKKFRFGEWIDYSEGVFVNIDLRDFNAKNWVGTWQRAVVPQREEK